MIRYQTSAPSDAELLATLHPVIAGWFRERFGGFSPPQRYAIPLVQQAQNCLISAPTGSGKTLSCFLAILDELVRAAEQGTLDDLIYCVYVSPLKALGNDIERNLQQPLKEMTARAGRGWGIRVDVRTGDTSAAEREAMRRRPPHILITTPESLAIALSSPAFARRFHGLRWLIVDEIHALASSKRGVHLALSLERLQEVLRRDYVRIGLSATINPLEEVAKFLVGRRYGRLLADAAPSEDPWRDCAIVDARFDKHIDLQVLSPVSDFINSSSQELTFAMYDLLDRLIQAHRTTLIFTNTRSGTERVVHYLKEKYPKYTEVIGAHHGSLSKEIRLGLEERLKQGQVRVCVSSTSMELGIDIGYIDLVILLGSPKSVTRALQRIGRSGHKLHDTIKGRVVVTDQDDLLECAVMLRNATQRKLETIHMPQNCLDVLAQQVFGMLLDGTSYADDLWEAVTRSYPYAQLAREDFDRVLEYLAGEYTSLEDRHVYAKITYERATGIMRKRGRLARVIYMTNVGTIPDESHLLVKSGDRVIGRVDEGFLDLLRRRDLFVLGGEVYRFKYARGMTIQVNLTDGTHPTVPSWFSEMLPLSFELAADIQTFRQRLQQLFDEGATLTEVERFIAQQVDLDARGVRSLSRYFAAQHRFAKIPHRGKILVEYYEDGPKTWVVFHALLGRQVNDALSRALAWVISRREAKDVELGITDHGFYLAYEGHINVMKSFELLLERDLREVLHGALDGSEILRRRFRHCATRSLMILRQYRGARKSVGRQQMKALVLQQAVERMRNHFPIMNEAYREVMEDVMDVANAQRVLSALKSGEIELEGFVSRSPSPFSLHLLMQGRSDLIKADDRQAFLQRMYRQLAAAAQPTA